MRQMADNAFLLFYGMDGGINSFSFDVGHDNATVAVIIIYPHHIQFTRDSVTGVPMVKNLWGVPYPPPYACRV